MRKSSISHQLTKTARRLSSALAPQLTKIEIPNLQRYTRLRVKITSIEKLQEAIKRFVLHNGRIFDPVEFEITGDDGNCILVAHFASDEIELFEGQKRLMTITLYDQTEMDLLARFNPESSKQGNDGIIIAKVKHSALGLKLFEVCQQSKHAERWNIVGAMDEQNKYSISTQSSFLLNLLNICGFVFADNWWSVEKNGRRIGQITPQKSCFEENSLCVQWNEDIENEPRIFILIFALIQTIREAHPCLMTIVKETKYRKMNIEPQTSLKQ